MFSITLNQLAVALLGAGAYIYHTSQRGGWSACAIVCGCLIQRSSPDPYQAIAQVAQVLIDSEAQQAAQDLVLTPAARAAYKAAWAASAGQPVPARFAAAEAAAAATEAADWPSTIRTERDNARTMQRLASITGRPSAAEAASSDEQPAQADELRNGWDGVTRTSGVGEYDDDYSDIEDYMGGYDDDDESDPYADEPYYAHAD